VNSLFTAGRIQTGDTPAKLLSNALVTFTTEYAKAAVINIDSNSTKYLELN
ncbi:MAG: hypothetical protein RIR83_505, partial [Pseudomonadota bacterium]